MIATELKTAKTFPLGTVWYRSTRGTQSLSALYAYNAPTLLLTQQHFKLFVENPERTKVFTFPYGHSTSIHPHIHAARMAPMGRDLLKILVICLLSDYNSAPTGQPTEQTAAATPAGKEISKKHEVSVNRPIKRRPLPSVTPTPAPRVQVGKKKDGTPAYRQIRVYSDEEVAEVENMILAKELLRVQEENMEVRDGIGGLVGEYVDV